MMDPPRLTDLQQDSPGVRRLAHGFATAGTWQRLFLRAVAIAGELLTAAPKDLWHAVTAASATPPRIEAGVQPEHDAMRIALYVHYSATGRVSEMVRLQLAQIRALGFAVVFISMAATIPEDEWQAVRLLCALVVQRRNFGLDFGAWHDLLPEVRRRWPVIEELMLANDSVLGPIRPLGPPVEAMRAGGEGLFGLTESLQGGPHLQSFMLLARGASVVGDVMDFIQQLYIGHSKWLLVQMAEVRLSRWIQRRGHRVAAVYGYDRLVHAVMADPAERERLAMPREGAPALDRLSDAQVVAMLHDWPLNPTQHLWHVLATRFGCPFLKTELIRRNPGRLPGVAEWAGVVPADAPCPLPVLQAHLKTL